jgi:hypothetical protein
VFSCELPKLRGEAQGGNVWKEQVGRTGKVAPQWHQVTIAPQALKKNKKIFFQKILKVNLSCLVILKAQWAWEYAGTIGNDYSFAHAKYGGNP